MTEHDNVIPITAGRRVKSVPMVWRETIDVSAAAFIAGVSTETVRRWCKQYGIGRQISKHGNWRVSRPALLMMAVADMEALDTFMNGDCGSSLVAPYFKA